MAIEYLKKAEKSAATGEADVRETVANILSEIESGGEDVARRYAREFDKWDGEIVVSADDIAAAEAKVPPAAQGRHPLFARSGQAFRGSPARSDHRL